MSDSPLDPLLARLETLRGLDPAVAFFDRTAGRVLPTGQLLELLRGKPMGHPAHPALVLVPAGAFISAGLLDLVPGQRAAVRTLVTAGLASSVPSALAGAADWRSLRTHQQRVGIVHVGFNLTGIGCYAASLAADARGHRRRARALRLLGLGAIGGGGYLGGHLSYRLGAGVAARSARSAGLTHRRFGRGSSRVVGNGSGTVQTSDPVAG